MTLTRYFRVDFSGTPKGHPRILYPLEDPAYKDSDTPDGFYENSKKGKLAVVAYANGVEECWATTEDEALFSRLEATGKITELTQELLNKEVLDSRQDVDVLIQLKGNVSVADEDALKLSMTSKGYTVKTVRPEAV